MRHTIMILPHASHFFTCAFSNVLSRSAEEERATAFGEGGELGIYRTVNLKWRNENWSMESVKFYDRYKPVGV